MKKIKILIPAKINLTLDVLNIENGYHNIKSLVTPITLFDQITVKKRKDKVVTLKEKKIKSGVDVISNNAYKTAKLFIDTFDTLGVDITIKKNIPVGAGLGGSSADIAGTLLALKQLYNIDKDVKPIADSLGSDSGFMLYRSSAVIEGRGDIVKPFKINKELFFNVIVNEESVSSKKCYSLFDEIEKKQKPTTDLAIKNVENEKFFSYISNQLFLPSSMILPKLKEQKEKIKKLNIKAISMTGSGSSLFTVFPDKKERDKNYKQLKKLGFKKILKVKTI